MVRGAAEDRGLTLEQVEAAVSGVVESDLLGIGELARASGLPVSALRFYDGAGVLRPAAVDPRTGYRRYAPDQVRAARLVARLRRVGMPLADVRALLAGVDPGPLLAAHVARLEAGLADARRELSAVRALLTPEVSMELSLDARALADALDAVRFAVGTDPDRPALGCVLVDADGGTARLVATDRYRLAVASAPATGGPARVLLPVELVDAARELLAGGDAVLAVDGAEVAVTTGGRMVRGARRDDDFPDWQRIVRNVGGQPVTLDVPAFRDALAAAPATRQVRESDGLPYDVVVLTLGAAGTLDVAGGDDGGTRVAVNRDFLADALAAGGRDQLVLELDGPVAPLAIRVPERPDTFSMLMPVRLPG